MNKSSPFILRLSPILHWLHWGVLAVCLAVTGFLWQHEREITRDALRTQFDFALRETLGRIEQRVVAYEQMLRGMQGLFASVQLTDQTAFRHYVETLRLDANFSGVKVAGVAEHVSAAELAAHVRRMRQLAANYEIKPTGARDEYAPVIVRELVMNPQQVPQGFDPFAEPTRRIAMERARDSGNVAVSGRVRLVIDEGEDFPAGFVMYLPVFRNDRPHDDLASRRNSLMGWVFAAFHMRDFMASLYGGNPPGVSLEIYDGAVPSAASLMYRMGDPASRADAPEQDNALRAVEYLVVGGNTWTVVLQAGDAFVERFGRDSSMLVAITGSGLSVLLALLVWLVVRGRQRAMHLAAEMTEEIRQMAQHDALTGLPNRSLFSDRMTLEIARAKRNEGHFALIFIDLDHFKPVNDQFGHSVGDALLCQVAERLRNTVRASDTVGRIGGDEFVVLLPDLADPEIACRLAEKICQSIRQEFLIEGHHLSLSSSLGVALYPENGMDELTLTKAADDAMYAAKAAGRDGVAYASGA